MRFRNALLVSVLVLAGASPIAFAQGGAATSGPGPSASTTTQNPMAVQLQLELNSLNSMTDAMGPMVGDAQTRLSLMKAYISDQKLDTAAQDYAAKVQPTTFSGLTFNQALATATENQQQRGLPTPSNSTSTLEAEVSATQMLVQGQWRNLNSLHSQVHALTAFLQSTNKLDAYMEWSQTDAAKKAIQRKTTPPPADKSQASNLTPQQIAANNARHQQYLAKMRQEWDEDQASNDPVATSPLSDHVNNNWAYDNRPYGGDYGGGYYAGSYWNGYADPYYDVWGYPAGWNAANGRAAWNRGSSISRPIAPMAEHPAMGGGGRR